MARSHLLESNERKYYLPALTMLLPRREHPETATLVRETRRLCRTSPRWRSGRVTSKGCLRAAKVRFSAGVHHRSRTSCSPPPSTAPGTRNPLRCSTSHTVIRSPSRQTSGTATTPPGPPTCSPLHKRQSLDNHRCSVTDC